MASCVELIELPVYSTGNEVNPINSHTIEFIDNCTESVAVFANVKVNSSQVVKDSTDIIMANRKNGFIKRNHNRAIDLALEYRRRRSTLEDKRKLNGEVVPIQKVQQHICRVETIPGTSLKICSCGTVSETAKSKKCQNCHKFFYDHWAQRCRIPPCPKCHFCRKAKSRDKPPYKCDRCGFEINAELVVSEQPSESNTEENIHPDNLSSPKPELLPTVLNILKICGNKSLFEETEEKSDSLNPVEDCATCSSLIIDPNTELIEETIEESDDFTIPFSLCLSEEEEHLMCEDTVEPPSTPPMNSTAGSFVEDDFITTQSSVSIPPPSDVTLPTCISLNQAVPLKLPPLPLSPPSSSGMVSPCLSSASTFIEGSQSSCIIFDHGQPSTDKTSSSYDSELASDSEASPDITQNAIAAISSNGLSPLVPRSVSTGVSAAQQTMPLPDTHLDLLLSQNEQLMDFQNEGPQSLCSGDPQSVKSMDTLHLLDERRPVSIEYQPCVLDGDELCTQSKNETLFPIKDSLLNESSQSVPNKANQDPIWSEDHCVLNENETLKGTNEHRVLFEDEKITNESTTLNEEHRNSVPNNETAPSKNLVTNEDSEMNQDALPIKVHLSSEEPVTILLSQNPMLGEDGLLSNDSPLQASSEDRLEAQNKDLLLNVLRENPPPPSSETPSVMSSMYPPTQNLSPPSSSEDSQSLTCKDEKLFSGTFHSNVLPTVEVASTVSTSIPPMSTGVKSTHGNPAPAIKSVYVPSLHKIRELVGLTLKRTPIEQYQQIQQKILANQIQAQIEIQRSILKSQTGDQSDPTSILGKNKSTSEDGKPAAKRCKNVFSDIVADVIQSIKDLDKSNAKAKEPSVVQPAQSLFSPTVVSTAIATPPNSKTVDSLAQNSSLVKLSLYSPLIQGPTPAEGSSQDRAPSANKDKIPLRLSNSFRKIEATGNDKIRVSLLKDNSLSAKIDVLSSKKNQVILPSSNFCTVNAKIWGKSEPSTIPLAGATREVDLIAGNYVPSLTSIKEEPTDHVTQDLNAEQAMINDSLVDVPMPTAANPLPPENNLSVPPLLKLPLVDTQLPPLLKIPLVDSSTLNTHPDSCNDAIVQQNTIPNTHPDSCNDAIVQHNTIPNTHPDSCNDAIVQHNTIPNTHLDSCNDAIVQQNTITDLPLVPSEIALPPQDAVTDHSFACIVSLNEQPSSSAANILSDATGNTSQVRLQVSNSVLSSLKNEGLDLPTNTCSYRPIRPRPTASIGGVLVQSLESRSPDQPPLSNIGGVLVSVLSSFAPPAKSQDSTIGDMSSKSPTRAPAESNRQNKKSSKTGNKGRGGKKSGDGRCKKESGASRGGGDTCEGGEGQEGAGDDKQPKKKRKQTKPVSDKKRKPRMKLYSVKLKDGFLHHVMWGEQRVVLMVPLVDGQLKSTVLEEESPDSSTKAAEPPPKVMKSTPQPGTDRKTRRKAKLEPMIEPEIEEGQQGIVNQPLPELDPLLESPSMSSAHIVTPCLSIYELRHKLFKDLPANTIYAYTYRHQIKTVKPPMHWHQVLKRMGGVATSSHTSRILEYKYVQRIVEHYGTESPIPDCLEDLCQNKLPKSRRVIDLSNVDPNDLLEGEHLETVPLCTLGSPKRKKSSKDSPLDNVDDSADGSKSREQSPDQSHDKAHKSQECHDQYDFPRTKLGTPPRISIDGKGQKQKHCPQCGTQLLKKSKKCYSCGKRFGLYSFGRRICPSCGHCNLAKMADCHECGHNLADAPTAIPDVSETIFPAVRSRKRLRDGYHGYEGGSAPKVKKDHHFSVSSSAPSSRLPSTADIESLDDLPGEMSGANNKSDDPTTPTRNATSKSFKFSGYQYGRIPWGEADVTCLVDESGTPRFCLPELCVKVLRNHSKSDVFEIVKDLDLPLTHGDSTLLKKLQALGLHSNRSPICRLIGPDEVWTLLDALQEQVPAEVHQHLETITLSSTPLLSPGDPTQSPALVPAWTAILEDDEHDFESTLHEVDCSDGQAMALLRTWRGEQYGSLTELWRKYFPEVNRSHLTTVLRRLKVDTIMPTGQQATLLRNANVISLRGAAGRLIEIEDMQLLLDDLCIPLQIGSSSSKKDKPLTAVVPPTQPTVPPLLIRKQKNSASYGVGHTSLAATAAAQGKALATKEDLQYAECMRNLLQVVELTDVKLLVEKAHQRAAASTSTIDTDNRAASLELDDVQQRISSHRELCSVLTDEIGFLNVSNHGIMSEVVRLSHTEKSVLQDLERLCSSHHMDLKI